MKYFRIYTFLMVVLFTTSCDLLQIEDNDTAKIYVSVSSDNSFGVSSTTRVPYKYSVPSSQAELPSLVLVSTESGTYTNNQADDGSDGPVHLHVPATFRGGNVQVLNGPLYNKETSKQGQVYFSALSPNPTANGWSISNDGKTALFVFNGTQDVMFAPQVSGSYAMANPTGNTSAYHPELNFKHLLSLINLSIYAETEEVKNAWGKLQSITIRNAHDMGKGATSVNVNLGADYNNGASVSFTPSTEDVNMNFYQWGNNEKFPIADGYVINYKPTNSTDYIPPQVAYVMMAPVEALEHDKIIHSMLAPEFDIDIKTEKRSVSLSVDL